MYSPLQSTLKFIRYYLTAANGRGHGMHSPFVFDLISNVLRDKTRVPDYKKVEGLRSQLKNDRSVLQVEDLGAGSGRNENRTVASIANRSLKPRKFGQLFYRMVRHYGPKTILELGTSLGVTTCYLAIADPAARVITMEGAPEIAAIARENFQALGLENIELVTGNFETALDPVLSGISSLDLVFIDGNHRHEPTEKYFKKMLSKIHNDSIIIVDDIHWSPEMELAWEQIMRSERVTCSVDLYFAGLVFFRQEFRDKQHFTIRF